MQWQPPIEQDQLNRAALLIASHMMKHPDLSNIVQAIGDQSPLADFWVVITEAEIICSNHEHQTKLDPRMQREDIGMPRGPRREMSDLPMALQPGFKSVFLHDLRLCISFLDDLASKERSSQGTCTGLL